MLYLQLQKLYEIFVSHPGVVRVYVIKLFNWQKHFWAQELHLKLAEIASLYIYMSVRVRVRACIFSLDLLYNMVSYYWRNFS